MAPVNKQLEQFSNVVDWEVPMKAQDGKYRPGADWEVFIKWQMQGPYIRKTVLDYRAIPTAMSGRAQ